MEDKKNENEKIMKFINNKLKDGQIPLMLVDVYNYIKSDSTQLTNLVITSHALYFIINLSIKKYFKASLIQCIALTPFSNQMVIFYDCKGDQSSKDIVRFQSQSNVKIIQDIISVRQKFCQMTQLLAVMITYQKNLEKITHINQSSNKGRFFGLFKKKESSHDLQNRLSGQGDLLYVSQKDFAIQISQKMYNQIYKNVKVLYINTTDNFRFFQQKYISQAYNDNKRLFRINNQQVQQPRRKSSMQSQKIQVQKQKNILLRKIQKQTNEQNEKLQQKFKKYRNQQYKQQLLLVIQNQTHFQVLSALYEDERDCQSLLIQHQYLGERDLRSICFKLVEMIQSSDQIFYSLSPQHIVMGKDGVKISKIFSCLHRKSEIDYISPQQLVKQTFTTEQIELINLWRVGVLLFQLAYGNVPFPIQYILSKFVNQKSEVQLNFPAFSLRTQQFQNFIKSILRIQPQLRGQSEEYQRINQTQSRCRWKDMLKRNQWLKLK